MKKNRSIGSILVLIAGIIIFLTGMCISFYPSATEKIAQDKGDTLVDLADEIIDYNTRQLQKGKKAVSSKEAYEISLKKAFSKLSPEIKKILERQELLGVLEIPKLKLRFPVVEGAQRDNIRASIGHLETSSDITELHGNCVLAGHRGGIYGEFFKNIDKLNKEDVVKIILLDGTVYTYYYTEQLIIEPTDVKEACKIIPNQTTLTLLSCNDNGSRRILVRCKLDQVVRIVKKQKKFTY